MLLINVCEYILSFPHTKERKKKKKKCIYIALLSLSRFFFFWLEKVYIVLRGRVLQTYLEQPWTSSKASKTQLLL